LGIQTQDLYTHPTAELLEKHLTSADSDRVEDDVVDVNELLRRDANLDSDIEPQCILLTGATGFLGSHILRELNGRNATVICLVRDYLKLNRILEYYFPEEKSSIHYVAVEGDVEKPKLGLSDEMYAQLVERVDMVIHTAAKVSHAGHYEDFERINVIGTQNVIEFCKESGAVLQHTSTASVSGSGTVEQRLQDVEFNESCLNIGQKYKQNVYIHSKYKAEELVLIARSEGLKANIFRIGNLTWRIHDGKFQINAGSNGFVQRIRGVLKLGIYGEQIADYTIDFTPVDACARAYVELCFHKKVNNVYHMYNHHTYSIQKLSKMYSFRIRKVSQSEFEKKLRVCKDDKDVAVLGFYNSMAAVSREIPISSDFTINELRKLGFRWPKVGLCYLRFLKEI
jgi:thioester reductase-like protein